MNEGYKFWQRLKHEHEAYTARVRLWWFASDTQQRRGFEAGKKEYEKLNGLLRKSEKKEKE